MSGSGWDKKEIRSVLQSWEAQLLLWAELREGTGAGRGHLLCPLRPSGLAWPYPDQRRPMGTVWVPEALARQGWGEEAILGDQAWPHQAWRWSLLGLRGSVSPVAMVRTWRTPWAEMGLQASQALSAAMTDTCYLPAACFPRDRPSKNCRQKSMQLVLVPTPTTFPPAAKVQHCFL